MRPHTSLTSLLLLWTVLSSSTDGSSSGDSKAFDRKGDSDNSNAASAQQDPAESSSSSSPPPPLPPSPPPAIVVDCAGALLPGQYLCSPPDVDPATQQPFGCRRESQKAHGAVKCVAVPGINCGSRSNGTFERDAPCKWTNGYEFDTALLLSVFLGMFGADRFYLGYPAIGLLKFSTLGFFFLGHLLDIVLIASQVVQPADGSSYIINYFGPVLEIVGLNDETARKPQPDWY